MRFKTRILLFIPFLAIFLTTLKSNGQGRSADTTVVVTDTTNIDALFKKARELSYKGNYTQARRICIKILEKNPTYYDVRTFLGRTYAWEKQYDNARTELSRVLIEKENDYEALNALFDVEYWTESYSVAGDYLKVALGYYPTSEELLLKKAKLQIKLEEKNEAALTLRRILDLNPGQKEAISMMNSLEGRKLNNNFQTSFLVDLYDKRDPQQFFNIEFGRTFNFGSLTIRSNMADKFGKKGYQYEIENYTHITPTTYINLLMGFSGDNLFPKQKYNAELYQKIFSGFEVSGGIRYQKFLEGSTSYTASLSNYYKDYWFNVRTFISPKTDSVVQSVTLSKISLTLIGTIRVYFGDSDNFLGIKAGTGRSPDETKALDLTKFYPTTQAGIEIQRRAFGRWLAKWDLTYAKENPVRSKYTQRVTTSVTLKTVF
jgi:YaiO family outer membrane protein